MTSTRQTRKLPVYQFDEKVWENGELSRTWQFGKIARQSFLWVNFETPATSTHSNGGFHVSITFFAKDSPFGVEFDHGGFNLAFYFFTEYFPGWTNC